MRQAAQSLLRYGALVAHQQAASTSAAVQVRPGWGQAPPRAAAACAALAAAALAQPLIAAALCPLQAVACAGSRRWFATNSHDIFNTVREAVGNPVQPAVCSRV